MNSVLQQLQNNVKIYFVRHGQSKYNEQQIVAGRTETPLTDLGKEQAKKTGLFLRQHLTSPYVLYSPITRAKETALLIQGEFESQNNNNETPIEEEINIIEIDAGVFTNKKIVDIEVQDPELFAQFKQHSWEAVSGAEKIVQLIERVKALWQKILHISKQGYTEVVVVSHGGIMQWLFKTSFGFEGEHVKSWAPITKVSNCGIYCLDIEKKVNTKEQAQSSHATWTLLNYVAH